MFFYRSLGQTDPKTVLFENLLLLYFATFLYKKNKNWKNYPKRLLLHIRFRIVFASFLHRFWIVFTQFFHCFCVVFLWFLHRFWIVFSQFLHCFCVVFGSIFANIFCQGQILTYLKKCKWLEYKIFKTFTALTLCQIFTPKRKYMQ